jgi:HPt (histidine-containing phosphotransfer) domain-containing protein
MSSTTETKTLRDYLPRFFENRWRDLAKARHFLELNQLTEVARLGHAIKGVARPFGFPELETLAAQLELASEESDASRLAQILDSIENMIRLNESKIAAETNSPGCI